MPHPRCAFWAKKTTNHPARRCTQRELILVAIGDTLVAMCRPHRNEYVATGRIRTYEEADKTYSTRCYRPVARSQRD